MKSLTSCCWLALVALWLVGCGKANDLSELGDGLKLQQDCIRLMEQIPSGEISKVAWPTSIRALQPIQVTRETNSVRIVVKREQGKFTLGYDVFADPQLSPSTQGVWVQKTKFKGVYVFKLQY